MIQTTLEGDETLMKSCISICTCILLTMVISFSMITEAQTAESINIIETFDYAFYEEDIIKHKSDLEVEPIVNYEDAIEKAEQLLLQAYSWMELDWHKPFIAFYNTEYDLWLIRDDWLANPHIGCVYCVIEGSTGRAIAIWYEK